MSTPGVKYLLIGLAMLAAAGMAIALTPRDRIADHGPKLDLEAMIPKHFGNWQMDETVVPIMPDPGQQALLNKIYSQVLSRTYISGTGSQIMLAIAYGGDQSDAMQVHQPEICYPAQGFQIYRIFWDKLKTINGQLIPVKRLVAVQGPRNEPITYWITLGKEVPDGSLRWKLAQLKYGLTGKIPDGLLFRVSSISPDDSAAFALENRFINDLLAALPSSARAKLAGVAQ